jgi:hypoxanthine phosphoribosyltransferase
MDHADISPDLESVVATEEQILARLSEMAADIERDYAGRDLVLVGVLGGAATMTVDLARAMSRHVETGWMAVRSYGSGVRSSGSVRLLKDLDVDVKGRDVLIVDTVVDTGLTIQWLVPQIAQRTAASVRAAALFRKPTASPALSEVVRYVGFEVGDGMLVGYGLDYAGRYRNLRCCAVLAPHVYNTAVAAR